ncbi:MAG TPA: caspase family protein, partial [Polyangia bacterium]
MERALRAATLPLLLCLVPSTAAFAAESTRTFALVVTNNRSSSLTMPDLQYADDDGARYFRLFRSVADADSVVLLTTFDRSSAAAYPDLAGVAKAPTKAAVETAARQIAAAVKSAREGGAKTTFYFVYAGHGDVEEGRGTVDLEDGRVDGQFIERAIIETIPADTKHVLLDSCDSFFVLNPRKPGGRRWATPKDMALGFSKRHPEVGLFLSTNSDAEVFEWSELESGVFSHELRSGLSGAADVDGDGSVSYAEA